LPWCYRGSLDITKAFKHGDLPCGTVKYTLTLKGQKKERAYMMNECKAPDGNWKFMRAHRRCRRGM